MKMAAAARPAAANAQNATVPAPQMTSPHVEPTQPVTAPKEEAPRWNWTPVLIGFAVLCWIIALSMLFTGSSPVAPQLSSPRLTFAVVWAIAAAVTFVPLEFKLGLPGLTIQGVVGWTFLGYLLGFVPAPTGWLLDLPDLPVYLLFFLALFYAVSAAMLPLTVLGGRRFWAHRLLQLDMRRARRQSYELGILVVGLMALAGLRVLSPLTGLLFLAVMVLIEMLLLSQVAPEG
jgi:hypothetical protein